MLSTFGTDRQLLDQFVQFGDQGAFDHGVQTWSGGASGMSWRVARSARSRGCVSGDISGIGTQSTHAQRSGSCRRLAPWGGVSDRGRARCRTARRRAFEKTRAEMWRHDELPEELAPDQREIIREELERLPAPYQQAVLLCYLEGSTHQEAARKLGWPLGTVKIRLVPRSTIAARATRSSRRRSGRPVALASRTRQGQGGFTAARTFNRSSHEANRSRAPSHADVGICASRGHSRRIAGHQPGSPRALAVAGSDSGSPFVRIGWPDCVRHPPAPRTSRSIRQLFPPI